MWDAGAFPVPILILGEFAVWALGRSRQIRQAPVAVAPPNQNMAPPRNQPNFPVPPMAATASRSRSLPSLRFDRYTSGVDVVVNAGLVGSSGPLASISGKV